MTRSAQGGRLSGERHGPAGPGDAGRQTARRREAAATDALGGADLARAAVEVAARLDRRGVRLSGRETSEQLVDLLDAVERFEETIERAGADLLVDEPVRGARAPILPDNPAFVLPIRLGSESAAEFLGRIVDATAHAERLHRGPPIAG
jgi:hypothetical protein